MKVEVKDILEDEIIKSWWKRVNARDSTKIRYAQGIAHFFAFVRQKGLHIGNTPSEVLEYARGKVKEDVLLWRDEIEGIIAEFEDWLKEKPKILNNEEQPIKLAPKTINNNVAAVKSFFNAYNIDVPKRKGRRELKPLVENNHRLTKEIVREAIKYADVRQKAVILLGLSSGMGDSEIINLRVGDFIKGRGYEQPEKIADLEAWILEERRKCEEAIEKGNLEYGITMFEIRRHKTTIDYITFITPEATVVILDYLAWRNRKSEHIVSKGIGELIDEKRKTRSSGDYLFIKHTIEDWYLPPEDIEKLIPPKKEEPRSKIASKSRIEKAIAKRTELGLEGYADEIRKLDRTGLMTILRRLAKKAGIDTKFGVYQILRGHNLRKLFFTILKSEGVDSFTLEYWMGHKINDEQAAYFEPIPEKMKRIYAKYMHALFIGEFETKVLASKEYTELTEKIEGYKKALAERNGEMAKLREEIESMKLPKLKEAEKEGLLDVLQDPETIAFLMKKMKEKQK